MWKQKEKKIEKNNYIWLDKLDTLYLDWSLLDEEMGECNYMPLNMSQQAHRAVIFKVLCTLNRRDDTLITLKDFIYGFLYNKDNISLQERSKIYRNRQLNNEILQDKERNEYLLQLIGEQLTRSITISFQRQEVQRDEIYQCQRYLLRGWCDTRQLPSDPQSWSDINGKLSLHIHSPQFHLLQVNGFDNIHGNTIGNKKKDKKILKINDNKGTKDIKDIDKQKTNTLIVSRDFIDSQEWRYDGLLRMAYYCGWHIPRWSFQRQIEIPRGTKNIKTQSSLYNLRPEGTYMWIYCDAYPKYPVLLNTCIQNAKQRNNNTNILSSNGSSMLTQMNTLVYDDQQKQERGCVDQVLGIVNPYTMATLVDERNKKYKGYENGIKPDQVYYRNDTSCYGASTGFGGFQQDIKLQNYIYGTSGKYIRNYNDIKNEDEIHVDENGWGYNTDFLLMKHSHTNNTLDGLGCHSKSNVFDICRRRRWYRDTLLVRFLRHSHQRYR